MINIPVSKPTLVKVLTIVAGVASIVVAQYAPAYSQLLADVLRVLGITAVGVGGVQITAAAPKSPDPNVFPQTSDGKPLSVRPPEGLDAEFRAWRPAWLFSVAVLLLACDPRNPPCDESRLRAIDAAYVAEVTAKCLPKYSSADECPEFSALREKHRAALRQECPQ